MTDNKLSEVERAIRDAYNDYDCNRMVEKLLPVISRLLDAAQSDGPFALPDNSDPMFKREYIMVPRDMKCHACGIERPWHTPKGRELRAAIEPPDQKGGGMNDLNALTMHCANEKCDFEYKSTVASPIPTHCPKCFGTSFTSRFITNSSYERLYTKAELDTAHADALRAAAALFPPPLTDTKGNEVQSDEALEILALTPEHARLEHELEVARAVMDGARRSTREEMKEHIAKVADLEAKLAALESKK